MVVEMLLRIEYISKIVNWVGVIHIIQQSKTNLLTLNKCGSQTITSLQFIRISGQAIDASASHVHTHNLGTSLHWLRDKCKKKILLTGAKRKCVDFNIKFSLLTTFETTHERLVWTIPLEIEC